MRVKKLNATRRPRAGEDDAAGLGGDSSSSSHSPSQWASPTKPSSASSAASFSPASDESFRRPEAIDIGAGSPTDPTAAPPVHPHDVSELDLSRQYYLASVNNHTTMANAQTAATKNATAPPPTGASVRVNNGNASTPSPWRESVDRAQRESVHQKIVEYLSTLKPNAPPKVLEKLPGLAYRMEEALFKMATSEHEYSDQATLPQRLTLIQQANARRLLQQQCPAVSPKEKDAAAPRSRKPLNEEQARVVFSCLQSWRQKLVNMYGATPWDILPNKILAKVAVFIPSTTQELLVCGVANEQLERFGNSLLQEIEKVMNALNANASAAAAAQQMQAAMAASRSSSPSGTNKRPSSSSGKATNAQGANKARGSTADQAASKKRKTATETSSGVRLAAATPSYLSANSFIAPSPTLIRPMDPAFLAAAAAASSLPALLPSGANANASANGKKTLAAPPAFFPRIPVPGSTLDQDNRMHLLAQGVGQLSQQQEQQQKQQDSEKEIQALRWLLQESQREKALLEAEVQRLRQQGAK